MNAGRAFCIEGSVTGSTSQFQTNKTILNNQITGIWQGRCTDNGSNVICGGSVNAQIYNSGSSSVADVSSGYCYVANNTGTSKCMVW